MINKAYVSRDISQKTMEHLISRIQALNYMYFVEDELDLKGTKHNALLYITIWCKDVLISMVLIDNYSALNVLPRHMLEEKLIDVSYMKLRTMMVRAYGGSLRQIVGTLKIEQYMEPQMFLVKLQVMNIHLSYSILLERPCVMTLFFLPGIWQSFPYILPIWSYWLNNFHNLQTIILIFILLS